MANKRIQGITIEIGGDTSKLQTALRGVDKELSKTQGNLKDINKLLKFSPGNTELLVQKQKNLQESIKATEDRLKTLKSTQTDALSPDEYDALQREIIETEQRLESLKDEYKDFGSVAQQKIAAVGQSMQDVGGKISDAGRKMQELGSVVPNKLKAIGSAINEHVLQPMLQVAKVVGAAGFAAGTALTKGAVDAAAEYEQLVGGVETLFKDSSASVIKNARNAYKTSGKSANEYMKTVTAFSASLLQSLDGNTQKSAKMADMAIRDMSDNANKFGTDMASVEAAYQGFAKQQYALLDNLKLGYGGSKSEVERLIRDAEKLDETFKVTHKTTQKGKEVNDELVYSYADIIDAIHIVQTNMGVTGTTAAEASKTIEGSMAAAKAAWYNLLTAIGTGEDVKGATKTMLDAAGTYLKDNLFPTIQTSLGGITEVFDYVLDRVIFYLPEVEKTVVNWLAKIPAWINEHVISKLPWLFQSAYLSVVQLLWQISGGIAKWLGDDSTTSQVFTGLKTSLDNVIKAIKDIGGALMRLWTDTLEPYFKDKLSTFITDTLPQLTSIIGEIAGGISGLIDWFNELDPETKNMILDVGLAIVTGSLAISTIGKVITKGGDLIKKLGTLITFLSGPSGVVVAIAAAIFAGYLIIKNWDKIREKAKEVGEWIAEHVEAWINDVTEWFDNLNTQLDTAIKDAAEWFKGLGRDIKTAWNTYFQPVVNWLGDRFIGAIEGIKPALDGIISFLRDVFTGNWESVWNSIVDLFGGVFGKIADKMKDPINAVIDGLNWMIDKVETAINKIVRGINKHVKIHLNPIDVPLVGRVWDGLDWGANLKTVNWKRIDYLANGGTLKEGQRAIVGEYAPEYLRVINGRAVVTPMTNQPGRMGGDTTVNITINTHPGQSAEDIAAAVKRVFTREMQQRSAAYA